MSAESEKIRQELGAQLSSLDNRLSATVGDVAMLADVQKGIGRLLADNGRFEGEIRRVLQERYDKGDLRKETYQLVKSMLDRYVSEELPTSPTSDDLDDQDEKEAKTSSVEDDNSIVSYDGESLSLVESVVPGSIDPVEEDAEEVIEELDEKFDELDLEDVEEVVEEQVGDDSDDDFTSTDIIPNEVLRPPTADDRVQVGSVLRDRFLLKERVSGGSMGVVYKALDRRLAESGSKQPWVAIKVLSPQLSQSAPALRALQQEATKGRCLIHPGIVRFLDLDRDDDLYFIVMEWMEGRTLAEILDSPDAKKITVNRAIQIIRQLGEALDYAHKCGIVHADVKPGNVMILPNGNVCLFDFGIARVVQAQSRISQIDTQVLDAITPEYSSMQVLTGDEPVATDDVYSLACVLYRLVAGYRVFGPRNAAEAAQDGMRPQRLDGLSDVQWRALRKALSFSGLTRFASIHDFMEALDRRGKVEIDPDSEEHAEETPHSSNRTWLFGLIGLLALISAAGYQFGLVDVVMDLLVQEQQPARSTISRPATPVAVKEDVEASSVATAPVVEIVPEPEPTVEAEPAIPLVDFSTLPPADFEIALAALGDAQTQLKLALREDSGATIIDLVRDIEIDLALDLRIEEVSYSGNRSPWASGQLLISNEGLVSFPAGQERARFTLDMSSDPLREADQQSTLLVRVADSVGSELATIEVVLEDDDQRTFEAELPTNTVAFAVSQIAVRERDPAAQIDVLRFNPDSRAIVVDFVVKDITATEGEDYFSPSGHSISFEPGQRSARLLIPLVQDSVAEGDEAFTVELRVNNVSESSDVYRRIVIMISDDDAPRQ
jgi:serine/threonine protein kinase